MSLLAFLDQLVTIKRSATTVSSQRVVPGSWTTVAENVRARIESAGSSPEATVLGIASKRAFRCWIQSTAVVAEDEIRTAGGTDYRVVSVDTRKAPWPTRTNDHSELMLEERDT